MSFAGNKIRRGRSLLLACLTGGPLLAGCGAVGDGNAIESIEISISGFAPDEADGRFHVAECLQQAVVVTGYFSDGSGSNGYASRAEYTSSNPDVVEVSDGTIETGIDSPATYVIGRLLPKSPGTATITAEFVGLRASMEVVVEALGEITFNKPNPTIAVDTSIFMDLETVINENVVNVRTAAFWSFAEPDDEVATIRETNSSSVSGDAGLVIGQGVGGPLLAQAQFPLCGRTLTTEVTVAPVDSLTLEREFDGTEAVPASGELIEGTQEQLFTYANFASGAERQDLTTRAGYESSDPSIALPLLTTGAAFVSALAAGGPVEIQSFFGEDDEETEDVDERIVSNALPVTVVDVAINGLVVSPASLELPLGCSFQLTATGSFDGSRTQPVTRSTSLAWSTEDSSIVIVDNVNFLTRGTVRAVGEVGQATDISATYTEDSGTEGDDTDDVEITDTVTVTVVESGPCPDADDDGSP